MSERKPRTRISTQGKKEKKPRRKVKIEELEDNDQLDAMVKTLMSKTKLSEKTIRSQYKSFVKECPEGIMSREMFSILTENTLGSSKDVKFITDSIFRVFDYDNSGTMDFQEYIMAINATKLESPEEKLQWIFNVFDIDGGGSIDSVEIKEMVAGLFAMAGAVIDENDLLDCTEDIMEAIDIDGDGEITKDEFVQHAGNSQFVSQMLMAQG